MTAVEVHCFGLDPGEAETARLAGLLDEGERAHAARFRFDRDRRRFLVRRGRLREVLGRATGVAPARLAFTTGSHGKPALPDGPCFSLSHSGERMMLVLADRAVGCDIERIDDAVEWAPLAERLFAAGERRALAALPEADGRRGFFECWARKEAFVKALGLGLSYPLEAFEVAVGPEARLLAGGAGWAIAAAAPGTGFTGAVVALDDGGALEISFEAWETA